MNGSLTFWSMLPEHLLLLGVVTMLGVEIWPVWKKFALPLAIVIVAAAAGVAGWMYATGFSGAPFPGQLSVTPVTALAKAIVFGLTVPVLLMSRDDFSGGEFPALIMSSLYGVCLLISADSFLTMFIGLELMSLPVYALVLLAYRRFASAEAALKYLVLGGTATAMFLMGVSLLYGVTGSTDITMFATALGASDLMSRASVVLIVLAFFLKGAIVPFHAWAPDAYEGASVSVTAYMATIVKAGVLFAIVRLFAAAPVAGPVADLLAVFPLISIVWGNLAAMRQRSFRRMIAYSSIAHAGYLFYALLGDGAGGGRMQAVTFYLLAYGALNLLAFAALPRADDDGERDKLENFRGLYQRNPFAAIAIAIAMFSLAGLPPFPGFVAKFLIFRNVMAAGYTTYAVVGLVGSYIGIYFYLRVIQFMFMGGAEAVDHAETRGRGEIARPTVGITSPGAVFISLLATVLLMVVPGLVLDSL
ncbi:MAG: NADH-quinone oxidoreductase subunit N, partial [Gemmatimonadota bacterium]|nr:NADH-quinone oxidoreductase subunit N [Gemmatimonadota bacterium]